MLIALIINNYNDDDGDSSNDNDNTHGMLRPCVT